MVILLMFYQYIDQFRTGMDYKSSLRFFGFKNSKPQTALVIFLKNQRGA
jgi:hypothetical protein